MLNWLQKNYERLSERIKHDCVVPAAFSAFIFTSNEKNRIDAKAKISQDMWAEMHRCLVRKDGKTIGKFIELIKGKYPDFNAETCA